MIGYLYNNEKILLPIETDGKQDKLDMVHKRMGGQAEFQYIFLSNETVRSPKIMGITRLRNLLILLFLTLALGVLMGGVSAAFLMLLELVTFTREHHLIFVAFLPAVGILTATIYHKFGKDSQRGNNLIIDSVHKQAHVPFRTAIFTFVFTILSHLTGGSVGREGTAVQIGGTLANKLGNSSS